MGTEGRIVLRVLRRIGVERVKSRVQVQRKMMLNQRELISHTHALWVMKDMEAKNRYVDPKVKGSRYRVGTADEPGRPMSHLLLVKNVKT